MQTVPGAPSLSGNDVDYITDEARVLINESTSKYFTDPEILKWINRGIEHIIAKTWCVSTQFDITLAADTLEYTYSTGILAAVAVIYKWNTTGMRALTLGHPAKVGHEVDTGDGPSFYYVRGNAVGIYPVQTSDTSPVRAMVVEQPTALTAGSDPIPIPWYLEQKLIEFVTAMALFKDKKRQDATAILQSVEAELAAFRSDLYPNKGE